jgi:hypothetical protein
MIVAYALSPTEIKATMIGGVVAFRTGDTAGAVSDRYECAEWYLDGSRLA